MCNFKLKVCDNNCLFGICSNFSYISDIKKKFYDITRHTTLVDSKKLSQNKSLSGHKVLLINHAVFK